MEKIAFHPFDLKSHGAHMGLFNNGKVRLMGYDLPDDVYVNDQPIKTCNVTTTQWIEETQSIVFILEDAVVIEDTCEEVGTLCVVIPHDKVEEILRPLEELL